VSLSLLLRYSSFSGNAEPVSCDGQVMATDIELLRESLRRPDAFVEVCARHAGDLSGWLRREVGAGIAEDLLAETFSRAWFRRRRFRDPGSGSAGPWLQGIAHNLVRDYRRRGAIEARALRRLGLPLSADHAVYAETDERISAKAEYKGFESLVADLPAEQREALELRVIDDLGYAEIGERLAINAVTARTRVHRALKTLRGQTGRSKS
jgi:RNA polymerase sigma factor (sigma-70 family)